MLRHALRQVQQSRSEVRSLACAASLLQQALHTDSTARWAAEPEPSNGGEQQQPQRRQGPGAPPAAGRQQQDALTVQQPVPLLQRALALYNTAANAVNRILMLVSSLRHHSANEEYVRRYLERALGMDTFTLEYLHVMRPAVFRLSVARDIEPVVAWLRSVGISGEELVELVRHTPAVLSASVDDQLEPLSALIQAAGGSPRDVLLAYPGLAAVPVAHLKGTRHLLRQLGVAEEDVSLLLVSLPDLNSQLADALARLFIDFGAAARKLQLRQRRQLAGNIYHHMRHWTPGPAHEGRHGHGHGHSGGSSAGGGGGGGGSDSDSEQPAVPPRPRHGRPRGMAGGHRLSHSVPIDHELYSRLKNVVAALEALSLQEESEEDWEAAASQMAHAIQRLSELAEAEASRQGR